MSPVMSHDPADTCDTDFLSIRRTRDAALLPALGGGEGQQKQARGVVQPRRSADRIRRTQNTCRTISLITIRLETDDRPCNPVVESGSSLLRGRSSTSPVAMSAVPESRSGSGQESGVGSNVKINVDLQHEPLDLTSLVDTVRSPSAGAIVTFSGTTRDSFDGARVLHLDYECHPVLARATLRESCLAAAARWPLLGAACVHRLGRVPVGEESILIAVSSPHRKAAWEAGEWILEEVKRKAEVWKRETFVDDDGDCTKEVWKANEEFHHDRKRKSGPA